MYIKNTASQNLPFCLVNASTGAAVTGATVTAKRCLDGAAQASMTGTVTETAGGQYNMALSQADTNADTGGFLFTATGAIPVHITIPFFAANIPANATQFAGQTITAAAGVTLPSSVASPTNITAGIITTVTNLTNAPTSGDLTATMKTSVTTAATAATPVAASVTGAVGSVTGNVGGNVTGSVGSVVGAVGSVTAAVTVSGDLSATMKTSVTTACTASTPTPVADPNVALIKAKTDNLPAAPAAVGDIPTAIQNADALLKRDWTSVTGEAARSVLNALRFLRNKWSVTTGTLTVTKEDDSAPAWTAAISTDAAAVPVTGSDPV